MVGETFTYVTFKTVLKFVLVKRLKAWVIRNVCAEHQHSVVVKANLLVQFLLQLFSDSAYARDTTEIGCYTWERVAMDDEGTERLQAKPVVYYAWRKQYIQPLQTVTCNINHVKKCVASRHSSHMCENICERGGVQFCTGAYFDMDCPFT